MDEKFKKQLEKAINDMKVKTVYRPDGSAISWKGSIDVDDIIAPHPNMFMSEQNKKKWTDYVASIVVDIVEDVIVDTLADIVSKKKRRK